MKRRWSGFIIGGLVICLLFGLAIFPAYAKPSKDAIKAGMTMPAVKFPKPLASKDQKYLGLAKRAPFTLSELPAMLVLIEVFSST